MAPAPPPPVGDWVTWKVTSEPAAIVWLELANAVENTAAVVVVELVPPTAIVGSVEKIDVPPTLMSSCNAEPTGALDDHIGIAVSR